MFDGYLSLLALVSLMIAAPALMVLCYQWGEKNGRKQIEPRMIEVRKLQQQVYDAVDIREKFQSRKDDRIFNTVKEFHNGVD